MALHSLQAGRNAADLKFSVSRHAAVAAAGRGIGGVTASTGMDAARRHTGVHAPVIVCKTIIANNEQLAYAA